MPFRDQFFQCDCGGRFSIRKMRAATLRTCNDCRGTWVSHADFKQLLQVMELAWKRAEMPELEQLGPGKRPCLHCREPMQLLLLAGEVVDSCEKHGIFFDNTELRNVLYRYMEEND